ncbi:multicopper oxidase family protein [Streptomyces sp. NK08204]|uniref:multicopper oxidase family protein n=1 Tax=Streptomyces sp. NK08204 TaxID=2873260 RepID=UPI001CED3C86|nr:multicopper oxidase family protein [Streptomyces sp. NK08204]
MQTPSRRTVLRAPFAAVGAGLLGACSTSGSEPRPGPGLAGGRAGIRTEFVPPGPAGYVSPSGPEVIAVEEARGSGPVRRFRLTAAESRLDLGGRSVRTWAYDEAVPGPLVRATVGDVLSLTLSNRLPDATSLHSHGVRLRCDMDGVPDLTQKAVPAGADFTYRFVVAHPGTYFLHSHQGLQPDRALYAPLIVDDPDEPLAYDKEWIVVLDDWLDGVEGSTPEQVLDELKPGASGSGMMGSMARGPAGNGARPRRPAVHRRPSRSAARESAGPSRLLRDSHSSLLDGMGGSVDYPYYLANGRLPDNPSVFRCRPGDRIRLRIINAGSETAFRVALGDHKMTVTHTDGYPVEHQETDALLLGMAERYDVLVTAQDGFFPLVALPEGKEGRAIAVLRTDNGRGLPDPDVHPDELDGKIVPAGRLVPDDDVALDDCEPDRELRIRLTGTMKEYNWALDHRPYDVRQRHPVQAGERVRITLINATDMWHPVHMHGHTFALAGVDSAGALKDTTIVLPHRKQVIDFDCDNPGLWMLHCHNQYHAEAGMMTVIGYED